MNQPTTQPPARRQRLTQLRARARPALPFAAGVLAALVGLLVYRLLLPPAPPLTRGDVSEVVTQALASATPVPAYGAGVYGVIQPSLVLVQAESASSGSEPEQGLGSGVVINQQGEILTSLHVVDGVDNITLTFADGSQSPAEVTAEQPEIDIAVLRALQPPAMLVPAVLGNPGAMQVGDEVFAAGHPFGLVGSLSAGVVSGLGRSIQPLASEQRLDDLIQIDAAVNPGNSGGPLLNRNGEVVGIVTGLLNPNAEEVFVGVGFAVPITTAGGAAGAPPY